jgi:hypothetical protein
VGADGSHQCAEPRPGATAPEPSEVQQWPLPGLRRRFRSSFDATSNRRPAVVVLCQKSIVLRAKQLDVVEVVVPTHGERVNVVELERRPLRAAMAVLVDEAAARAVTLAVPCWCRLVGSRSGPWFGRPGANSSREEFDGSIESRALGCEDCCARFRLQQPTDHRGCVESRRQLGDELLDLTPGAASTRRDRETRSDSRRNNSSSGTTRSARAGSESMTAI